MGNDVCMLLMLLILAVLVLYADYIAEIFANMSTFWKFTMIVVVILLVHDLVTATCLDGRVKS
jgi:hypothetical protein